MDKLILTGWGWSDYAVAAAMVLRAEKKADVRGVSMRRLPELLGECTHYREIIIVGVGLIGNVTLLEKSINKLSNKNVKITWLSSLDLPDEINDNIRAKINHFVYSDDLPQVVSNFYETEIIKLPECYNVLLEGAMYAYRNYQDNSTYANVIKHIANDDAPSKWTSSERLLVEHYKRFGNRELVGKSSVMQKLLQKINLVADKPHARVLILGESGTGKETVALQIHHKSPRKNEPFIAFNCASVNPQLLESRFLGHEKDAFTGANSVKHGVFEQADGGTLFLDEIGELPLEAQGLLLRVLEEGRFCRMGDKEEVDVDVRLITATNRDLAKMVQDGEFREDLFHRLNIIPIRVPSLREHKDDLPQIANNYWLNQFKKRLSTDQIETLMTYDYPGNVRELYNLLERASVLEEDNFAILLAEHQEMTVNLNKKQEYLYPDNLEEMTKLHIKKVYAKNNNNVSQTAKALDASRNTVRKYLGE